jgi:L-lactate dehydrogenase complex protein LldG
VSTGAEQDWIAPVRRALGRTKPLATPPTPPPIDEPIARLVHSDIRLTDLYLKTAKSAKFLVDAVAPEDLAAKLAEYLKSQNCKRVGLANADLFDALGFPKALRDAGIDFNWWSELTLDESYDLDAGITDVWAALAETGSLVIRPNPHQGRALSLTPPIHVAIVQPKNIVADMLDLFEKMNAEDPGGAVTLITGPSQTADIEAVMVTGVHGPGIVKVFVVLDARG